MSAPKIDRILAEASPGEVRAVACAGETAWEIFHERPLAGPGAGDIYRARAGAPGPGGGRFFDLGDGVSALARRPRQGWTEGAYGLVQVLRSEAGDKGPRVTDRVWLHSGGIEVALAAGGALDDRIEIARRVPKAQRELLRAAIAARLPENAAVRVAYAADVEQAAAIPDLLQRLQKMAAGEGGPHRMYAAAGEVGWLVDRWPDAVWTPADAGTKAWLAALSSPPAKIEQPDLAVATGIDAIVADALTPEAALPGGARIWIEPTRALVAIDVDRGADATPASEINSAAGREIARQLRLRRLGGIVAVDFLREGLAEGLAALAEDAADDPWPWTPPRQADKSGLASFQRARLGASMAEVAAGPHGRAYAGLRACVRLAYGGGVAPRGLKASPELVHLLQTDLHSAVRKAEARLGQGLDLVRAQALGSIQAIGPSGEVLDEI